MKLPKRLIEKLLTINSKDAKWEKCMFGYVVHTKELTIRIYEKKLNKRSRR